ncbi:MAG TPA: TlpA family protein disulfide reductase [Hydrogenispora sp.]|jgi:peroxiredoxin|nr:TlpA family protein disulfide reductase [Hydrogenispora sp.]
MGKRKKWLLISGLMLVTLLIVGFGFGLGSKKEQEGEAARVGAQAPNFQLEDLSGEVVELKDVYRKNQLTMVNFWATWCPPCRREIPEFVRIYREYREQGLEILGVNVWEDSSLKQLQAFVAAAEMEFPILRDVKAETATIYQVRAVPTTVFIDQKGRILEIFVGALTYNQLQTRLDRYLP